MTASYRMTNREKSLEPRKGKFWCFGCDAKLVSAYQKCPKCRTRNFKKRFKSGKVTPKE